MNMHCEYYHKPMSYGQIKRLVTNVVETTIKNNQCLNQGFVINKRTPFFDNREISYEDVMAVLFDLEHKFRSVRFPESKYVDYKTVGDLEKDIVSQLTTKIHR